MVFTYRYKQRRNNTNQAEQQSREQTPTSSTLFDEEKKKELARFLFIGDDGEEISCSSLNKFDSFWYALALEPTEVQNERCIMVFECFAIFGALLIGAVWLIYEWRYATVVDGYNETLDRVFDCMMAVALICNVFMTVFASWFWASSIMLNSSQENFIWKCLKPITLLSHLMLFTTNILDIGLILGVISHFYGRDRLPENILCIALYCIINIYGERTYRKFLLDVMPLEIFHSPLISRLMAAQFHEVTKSGRSELQSLAEARAKKLRRQYVEKGSIDTQQHNWGSLENLLRTAITNLGRMESVDVAEFTVRLEKDWLTSESHIRGRNVEFLNKYMPLLLAEEVHRLLKVK